MGYCVKLLAHAHRTEEGIDVRVHPTMLPLSHQLATVNGVYNAIYVVGDAVGETMFFGEGAGSGPAASAVTVSYTHLRSLVDRLTPIAFDQCLPAPCPSAARLLAGRLSFRRHCAIFR